MKIQSKAAQERAQELAAQLEREEFINRASVAIAAQQPALVGVLSSLATGISQFMSFQGFWSCDNTGEKIALMHSELSEALEADRKSLSAEHIEGFTGVEEELADAVIRILDFAGHHNLRLGEAIAAKMQYNLTRPFMHGKKY